MRRVRHGCRCGESGAQESNASSLADTQVLGASGRARTVLLSSAARLPGDVRERTRAGGERPKGASSGSGTAASRSAAAATTEPAAAAATAASKPARAAAAAAAAAHAPL